MQPLYALGVMGAVCYLTRNRQCEVSTIVFLGNAYILVDDPLRGV